MVRGLVKGRSPIEPWVARNRFESRKIDQGRRHIESAPRRVLDITLDDPNPLIYKGCWKSEASGTGVYKVGFVSLEAAPCHPIYSSSTGSIDCLLPALGGSETVRPYGGVQIGEKGLLHRCGYPCGEEK